MGFFGWRKKRKAGVGGVVLGRRADSLTIIARGQLHYGAMSVMRDGRRFRVLNIIDDVTHECLAAITDTSMSGHRVAPPWLPPKLEH